jgi:Transcriptional regulators containing a DNA-binding HTH domain and an aminotransferase domain (MocR family) and their eukaryotic orthologs
LLKRECDKKHKTQLRNFDSPSLPSARQLVGWLLLENMCAKWNSSFPVHEGRSWAMANQKSCLKKRRHRSIIAFEMIRLDRESAEPLHQQLYRQIRDELKSGSFTNGATRLPSSRSLAVDLGI